MKKLAIAFAIIVVLLVLGVFLALRNLDSILESNREAIAGQVGASLGRSVAIGDLDASLGWGVGVRINELSVGDDPAYSKNPFLEMDEGFVRVKLLPALSGRVEVATVVLKEPSIRVIQGKHGMNIDSIGASEETAPSDAGEEGEPTASPLAVGVSSLDIKNASILYIDRSTTPPSETELGGADLDWKSDGTLEAFRGRVTLDADRVRMRSGDTEDASWEPLHLEADLRREGDEFWVDNARLRVPGLPIDASAHVTSLSEKPVLDALVTSKGGVFSGIPFEGLDGKIHYANQRAKIESMKIDAFDGVINSSGTYDMRRAGKPAFNLETDLSGVRIEQVAATHSEAAGRLFEGEVATDLNLSGTGSAWEALKKTLAGGGSIDVKDGMLRDINLAEAAFGSLVNVPGISEFLDGGLRKKYPALFGTGDTVFDTIATKLTIGGGKVDITSLALAARDFALNGRGEIGLDGRINLVTQWLTSEGLSADLLERNAKLKNLIGESGRVELPLKLRGGFPTLRPEPDVAAVAAAVGRAKVRDLLGKALGAGSGDEESRLPGDESVEPGDAKDKLLKKGIDSLFGR